MAAIYLDSWGSASFPKGTDQHTGNVSTSLASLRESWKDMNVLSKFLL